MRVGRKDAFYEVPVSGMQFQLLMDCLWHLGDGRLCKLPAVKLLIVEFAKFRTQAIHSNHFFGVCLCNSIQANCCLNRVI